VQYHATYCLAGSGAYRGWSKEKSYCLHNDLTRLIIEFPIVGQAFVMDLPSFAEVFHGVKRTDRFLYCFAHMLGGACALIRSYNAIHEQDQKTRRAKFVFDYRRFNRNEYFRADMLKAKERIDQMGGNLEYSRAYKEWLKKLRRQDNAASKIAFLAIWDAQLRREDDGNNQ
jgi:hypothetical protein